jgi:hypothetical protein
MNREGIRRLAAEELGLPTSPYAFAASPPKRWPGAEAVGYPCFVKPVMSQLGQGPVLCRRPADIGATPGTTPSPPGGSRRRLVIVEGRIDFDFEITLLTVRSLRDDGQIRDRLLRADRPPPGQGRLCRELAAAGDDAPPPSPRRRTSPARSPPRWAAGACSASSCS